MATPFAPDPRFTPLFPLQEQLVDKTTGLPLSAGTVIFYKDTDRTLTGLKNVYQQVQNPDNSYSYVSVGSTLTLGGGGTYVDGTGVDFIPFLYPYTGSPTDAVQGALELYFVQVYAANPPISDGSLQLTREAWPPGLTNSTNPIELFQDSTNELANPQFVQVNFTGLTSFVYNVSGAATVTSIAPGWDIVTNDSGTVTVTQIALAVNPLDSNPPYALDINSTGITSLILRQRLYHSPRLLANGFISGYMTAASLDGASHALSMFIQYSTDTALQVFNYFTTNDTTFTAPPVNARTIPTPTISVDTAVLGYTDVYIVIPPLAHLQISSLQLLGVQNITSTSEFIQESSERQVDHLFHYYNPKLEFKPIPSLLVGWDFALNPAQWGLNQTVTTVPAYIWDQTIMASAVNNMNVAQVPGTGALSCTSTGDTDAFYMIQYLQGAQALETALSALAVNLLAYSTGNGGVVATVYLYNGNTSSTIPSLTGMTPVTIGSINNQGVFTLTAGSNWTLIPHPGYPNFANLPFNQLLDSPIIGFDGLGAYYTAGTLNFAIVVTFKVPVSGTSTIVQSISCTPGYIATRPAPQSKDEVIRECEYYFEKSKNQNVALTSSGAEGALIRQQYAPITGANSYLNTRSFGIEYRTVKRLAPLVTLYGENGTSNIVTAYNYRGSSGVISSGTLAATLWTQQNIGTKATQYLANTSSNYISVVTAASEFSESFISFHYGADARIGVV